MMLTLLTTLLFQVQTAAATGSNSYLVETAIANGGIGAILFVIWFLTFKSTQKQFEEAQKTNREQFQFALKQNQDQFEKALVQIENQHKDNMALNQKTIDKLFDIMSKDAEYKELLAGVLEQMKESLTRHIEEHKG